MKRIVTAILALAALTAFAFEDPKPAADVLSEAKALAKKQDKNVMVIFTASWCGWCRRLDAFMAKPEFKPAFDADFVVVHLTVMESQDKKHLENAGGDKVLTELGGDKQGIPYFAILTPDGKVLNDSRAKIGPNGSLQNIGHPVKKEEVAHFMTMLDKAAKRMTIAKKAEIRKYLESQEGT